MNYRVAVLTLSDKGARGVREDRSGPTVAQLVCAAGFEVVYQKLLSDDFEPMQAELARLCDEYVCDLLLTTGGTGFSSRKPRWLWPSARQTALPRLCAGTLWPSRLAPCSAVVSACCESRR